METTWCAQGWVFSDVVWSGPVVFAWGAMSADVVVRSLQKFVLL